MDLTGTMLRAAAARPRVLVVCMPGGAAVRMAAERHLRLRDWPPATTPAQADLLFVAGPPCAYLHTAVERLWQDLPAPRARAHVRTADGVLAALDAARARLASPAAQREQEPRPRQTAASRRIVVVSRARIKTVRQATPSWRRPPRTASAAKSPLRTGATAGTPAQAALTPL